VTRGESRWTAAAAVVAASALQMAAPRWLSVGPHWLLPAMELFEWSSQFDCDEPDEDKVTAQIRDGVLVPGLRALGERFGPPVAGPQADT
jgi:hypothetical protein